MFKKKDRGWRPCADYCQLNTARVPNPYPLPNIANFNSCDIGSIVFSNLVLQKGYYQMQVEQEDIHKTTIITRLVLSADCLHS